MSSLEELEFEQERDGQEDTRVQSMFGRTIQLMSVPILGICIMLTILFGVAVLIILSLIPIYLGNHADSYVLNQGTSQLFATYKTDLSDQSSLTISDLNTLNEQLATVFHLHQIDLSITSYSFTSTSTSRVKRDTVPIQCDDGSTFSGVPLNFQFAVISTKKEITTFQWQQLFNKMQNQMRSIYKQFSLTIPFSNGQTRSTLLELCSLKTFSIDTVSTTTTTSTTVNKTRFLYLSFRFLNPTFNRLESLNCQLAILGAGVGGSHSAYRLSPSYENNLCVFERENRIGGRAYDIDYNGNVPAAYSTTPIAPMGCSRFYDGQPVVKQLADELNVTYYRYDYQTSLIKSRGRFYTSYDEMCSNSFVNLSCNDDANGLDAQDQIWTRLIDEYNKNASNLYHFADFNAFCRSLLGDEATDYLKESFRFRADFENTDPYSYMEFTVQDWNLAGVIYYPYGGLSQLSKRMIYIATTLHNARVYLNEEVIQINENVNPNNNYSFSIETSNYIISANQLVLAIPPSGWTNIEGTIANEIKSDVHFQSILPVKTVIVTNFWPRRWWEESLLFGSTIDRVWTRQNCISIMEIYSQHPAKRDENLTRTVYDDGLCVDTWVTLIQRSSDNDLIQELLRGLRSLFTDVDIPMPDKTYTHLWNGSWHFQRSNTNVTNEQIVSWALKPITRFDKHQISLVGEAYNIDRSGWTDGALKSSLMSLNSQFNLNFSCYANDAASNGEYCSQNYI